MVTSTTILVVLGVVLFGGLVKGFTGFGYALASTAILAIIIDPALAVVVVILPMLAANITLVGELDRDDLSTCIVRFWPFVLAAAIGTTLGMYLLDIIPGQQLRGGIGVFTLGYVLVRQPWVTLPGSRWFPRWCFRDNSIAKIGWGFISGVIFGVANIGVQIVAYLDTLSLSRSTFVGVLAMILVGISTLRVGIAVVLDLFGSESLFLLSAVAIVPGLVGVAVGRRLRYRVDEEIHLIAIIGLLTIIGIRLTVAGVLGW